MLALLAFICFILVTFGVAFPVVNLLGLGFVFLTLEIFVWRVGVVYPWNRGRDG